MTRPTGPRAYDTTVKPLLTQARRAIDAGALDDANRLVTAAVKAGATRADIANALGSDRLATMRAWARKRAGA